ncbi:hypothetical protein CCP3SC5AM1_3430002 [Gammaproteobacteria bacterium]
MYQSQITSHGSTVSSLSRNNLPCTCENLTGALNSISPDCDHIDWFRIAAALSDGCRTGGIDGWPIFDEWSQAGQNYNQNQAIATWKGARKPGLVTVGTLWQLAIGHNDWRCVGDGCR